MATVDRTVRPSFTKSLFAGRVASELAFPYPVPADDDRARTDAAVSDLRGVLDAYDPWRAEREGWVGDDTIRALGDLGLTGLFVAEEYGGRGLSQTGYCRVMEEFGRVDGTLSVVMGVHQSIGTKPIHLFGTDDQKARWLPDLAAGRKLAAFVLTEPNVGSDAYQLETWAERQSDGSWLLNGEKRWIGNGDKDVLTVFARSDLGHVALVVEKGAEGLTTGPRFETLGLKGNHLQRVHFKDVRVPAENLLGEPGDGFRIAMNTLNNGRMSMGTAISGGMKEFLRLSVEHTGQRRQFGRAIADFGMVGDAIACMTRQIYGLESLSYLTTGLVDRGDADYALESATTKVVASDVGWHALNRAFQLHGGTAYMADHPLSKALRDFRIFPIFEGANDVMRAYVALNGLKALSEELPDVSSLRLGRPAEAIGVIGPYVAGRVQRRLAPERPVGVHPSLARQAGEVAEQAGRLRERAEAALRKHGSRVQEAQLVQRRLADAAAGITAQTAVLGRVSRALELGGPDVEAERHVGIGFCKQSARQVARHLRALEVNDDDHVARLAEATRASGGYPFSL